MTVDRPRDLELCPERPASTTSCGARMITDTLASAHAHTYGRVRARTRTSAGPAGNVSPWATGIDVFWHTG